MVFDTNLLLKWLKFSSPKDLRRLATSGMLRVILLCIASVFFKFVCNDRFLYSVLQETINVHRTYLFKISIVTSTCNSFFLHITICRAKKFQMFSNFVKIIGLSDLSQDAFQPHHDRITFLEFHSSCRRKK